jgi:sigma-B regulation protein RsbU (phosphoserine phosphatase)
MPNMLFEEQSIAVEAGDTLFVYTDGLTDRIDRAGDFYSIDRGAAVLDRSGAASLETVYEAISEDIHGFAATEEFKDDIAFVVTRFH